MKEQIIQLPDNFEVKEIKDGKIILVEKEKKLTYEAIARKLFLKGDYHFYIDSGASINRTHNFISNYKFENNAISKKQLEKLLAVNKLMNIAKYLNDGWQPDWEDISSKYYISFSNETNAFIINSCCFTQNATIYFKSAELAKQAIEILGEETIRLALCTDY